MKATVKTKTASIAAFTQYQVHQNGLVQSFYDKKEAIKFRNKLNKST